MQRRRIDTPATRPVRVAYMITPFGDAGADRQLLELLRRIDRSRFEPTLYLSEANGHILDELRALEIPVHDVGGPLPNEAATARLVPLLRKQRPAIIHSWLFVANTWGRIAGKVARVPIIITSERSMELGIRPVHRIIDIALQPMSDCVIVNCNAVGQHMQADRHIPAHKLVTIYNGVDVEQYDGSTGRDDARQALGLPDDRPVVGMAAPFSARKRWDVFLRAMALVASRRAICVLCVGGGPLRPEMEVLAAALGLGDAVRFVGARADMPRVFAAQDVSVLSSDDEGIPNVVLQAMASYRPVVATDAGGTREVVVDGETGFIVPKDDPERLAEQVLHVLNSPITGQRFGEAGRRRVQEQFTFELCVERTMDLYESLLEARGLLSL